MASFNTQLLNTVVPCLMFLTPPACAVVGGVVGHATSVSWAIGGAFIGFFGSIAILGALSFCGAFWFFSAAAEANRAGRSG